MAKPDKNPLRLYPHTYYVCGGRCGDGKEGICQWCDGGLAWCTVCGAFEGQLLVNCPGFKLSEEALEACYRGNVVDLCGHRRVLRRTRDGRWVYRKKDLTLSSQQE